MHELNSVRDFSRTDLEHLLLAAAGWYEAGVKHRGASFHRIATVGAMANLSGAASAQCALEAVSSYQLALPPTCADLDVSGLVDLCVVFTGQQAPQGAPVLRIGPDGAAVIETLAIALRYLLSGGAWRDVMVDMRQLPPPLTRGFTALADRFPLTLLIDSATTPPCLQAGSVRVVADNAPVTNRRGIRAADNTVPNCAVLNTAAPALLLMAATWCGLLEVLATPAP